jgi:hypothetical protein
LLFVARNSARDKITKALARVASATRTKVIAATFLWLVIDGEFVNPVFKVGAFLRSHLSETVSARLGAKVGELVSHHGKRVTQARDNASENIKKVKNA